MRLDIESIDEVIYKVDTMLKKQGRMFLTVDEVAQIVGKSPATVYRAIKMLQLKATQFKGNWLITPQDLREYLQEQNNYNNEGNEYRRRA